MATPSKAAASAEISRSLLLLVDAAPAISRAVRLVSGAHCATNWLCQMRSKHLPKSLPLYSQSMAAQVHRIDRPQREVCSKPARPVVAPPAAASRPTDCCVQWLVLDTNVVLGWLLFRDPACRPLAKAIEAGRVRCAASALTRCELVHVLERGIPGWPAEPAVILAAWDAWVESAPAPVSGHFRALRCTDASDQKFIDLALAIGASGLLSRDRAVLKLARRARAGGLVIETPEQWTARAADGRGGASGRPATSRATP